MTAMNGGPFPDPDFGRAFIQTLNALKQHLNYQKTLGNQAVNLGDDALSLLEKWGTPSWRAPQFICQGAYDSKIVLVDSEGIFFEGPAGKLLVKILSAMHLTPETVCICNIADLARIERHVRMNQPKALVALGQQAGQMLKNSKESIETFRGRFFKFCGVPVMATYHPAFLLENPALKRAVWDDIKQVMACAGLGNHDS